MATGANVEADAIASAYEAQIESLFRGLVTNLGDQPISHQSDQECVAKFTTGLAVARRAKQLALDAIGAARSS